MPKPKKAPAPARPSTPPTAKLAYEMLAPERARLEPAEFATINIDISQAVAVVLGAMPGIITFADRLVALPGFEERWVRNLEDYVLGAWFAHLQSIPGNAPQADHRRLADDAGLLRNTLLGDADALVKRGIFDAQTIANVRAGQGHLDLANDLVVLSAMFLMAWDTIGGRTLATLAEVERAAVLGPELAAAVGAKGGTAVVVSAADGADQRARAYTLFVRAYGEVRRGLHYLRWHEGDADLIAPSLYRGRGGRSAGAVPEPSPSAPEAAAPLPQVAPTAPVPVVDPAPARSADAEDPSRPA